MTLSIEQLREAYKTPENTNSRPNNYYPFWQANTGEQAIVRFLPDLDPDNPLGFMVEKLMHHLTINGEDKKVPCLKMYGEDCPICNVSRAYYKDEGKDSVNGKKYWRKKQHIAQALIVEDPLPADKETNETHEGKVRFLNLGWQLFGVIKEAFESGDLDEVPYAYKGGCNFIIKATPQGDYDTYAIASKFARKSSDLTDEQIAFVQDHLVDLKTLLPAHPGLEKVEAMLEASLTGNTYTEDDSSSSSSNVSSTVDASADTPTTSDADSTDGDGSYDAEVEEMLQAIRNRRNQNV